MGRGGDHQDDVLAGADAAGAVNDRDPSERPTRGGLLGNACDLLLGHAGVVLELERGETATLIPAEAAKRHYRTDAARVRSGEARDLRGDIEVVAPHDDADRNHDQPPVIGGNSATSRTPAIGLPGSAWTRSSATRMTEGSARAWSYSGPRPFSHSMSSPTVDTPGGTSISSSIRPMRSRTQAKYLNLTRPP